MKNVNYLMLGIAFAVGLSACTKRKWEAIKPTASTTSSTVTCDTSAAISYSAAVVPILKTSCGSTDNSCHSAGKPVSNFPFDTYANVQVEAANGNIAGTLTDPNNYPPMPLSPYLLNSCDKAKLLKWIREGAKNN